MLVLLACYLPEGSPSKVQWEHVFNDKQSKVATKLPAASTLSQGSYLQQSVASVLAAETASPQR